MVGAATVKERAPYVLRLNYSWQQRQHSNNDISYGEEGLHGWICQIEIGLDRGFVNWSHLNFV